MQAKYPDRTTVRTVKTELTRQDDYPKQDS